MIHKLKKQIALFLTAVLLLSNLPMVYTSAAYVNGYTGGMAGDGRGIYAHGVDLSEWQGHNVDFHKIKTEGYSFVILRVGYATTIDDTFEENYAKAKDAGLDVGVYLYSYASSAREAMEEAAACKKWLAGKQLEYPVYYDLEDPKTHGNMNKADLGEIALAFLDELANDGWLAGLYSCLSWLNFKIDTEQVCAQYECWMAQYLQSGTYDIYDRYDEVYGMWQYSSTGVVDGVDGPVDLNICFKDYPAICRQYGFNGYSATGETLILAGVSVPDVLKTGNGFSVEGRIASTKGAISNVTVGIYDDAGHALMERSGSKGNSSYDISQLASGIRSETLSQGKYYYRITATNSYETRILLNQALWVSDSGIISDGVILPADLKEGESFLPSGVLQGAEKIEEVWVTVEDGSGKAVCKAVAFPGKTRFDLAEFQGGLDLTGLSAGEYLYRIQILTKSGYHQILSENFSVWVKNDPLTLVDFSLKPEYNPGELTGLTGTVRSEKSAIQLLSISVMNSAGEVVESVQSRSRSGQLELSAFDDELNLSALPVGQYRCLITALNAGGPVTLTDMSFLIREDMISLCEFSAPNVIYRGDSFPISGVVAGNVSQLRYVSVSVYDEAHNCVLSGAAAPDSNAYDLDLLNDKLRFSSLDSGEYTLCVTAENERGYEELYRAPFVVTDSEDRIFWAAGCFEPNGTAYSQSAPFALWGTLVSEVSDITEVTVEVLEAEGTAVTSAQLMPEGKEISLEACNEMLRLAALPTAAYRLRITAANAQGSYVMLQSDFSITECLHGDVTAGNAYFASCISGGAVCDSQCLDCGGKVRNGVLLPKIEHEYRHGYCGGCGRSEFLTVRAVNCMETPKNNDRFVVAVRVGENWYALDLNGRTVPIAAPNSNGAIFVSADLLWTANVKRGRSSLSNPFGQALHLDSETITVCRGNMNIALRFIQGDRGWNICLDKDGVSRFLSYKEGDFCIAEEGTELFLFLYTKEGESS